MGSLLLYVAMLIAGALLLTLGANYFVEGAAKLAAKLGVSELFIGITLVALGTSFPEFFVSTIAAVKGSPDISIGNVVGSNICNIGLILGTTALIRPIASVKSLLKFEYPLLLLSSLLMIIFSLNYVIGRNEGIVFLALLIIFIAYLLRSEQKLFQEIEEIPKATPQQSIPVLVTITAAGLASLIGGSELFIRAATFIARALGVSELIIGLSLVALGTSLPELASSIAATLKGSAEIATGNVVGSNILNIIFIIGTVSVIRPIPVKEELLRFDLPVMMGFTLALFLLLRFASKISRIQGFLLLLSYIIYIVIIYNQGRF